MVKVDFSRDYYADLELPPNCSAEDIKKQFRKLALKYHPDRNPGKELECNPRFQALQAANEVLNDPDQRATYDAGQRRPGMGDNMSRPTPPRGNPYQAKSDFPPPRMRTNNNTATPGAERYANFRPPPTRKDKPSAGQDARERATAFNAWQHMHDTQKAQSARQQTYTQPSGYQVPRTKQPNLSTDGPGLGRTRSTSGHSPPRTAWEETKRQRGGMDRPSGTRVPPRAGFDPANAEADEGPARSHTPYAHPRSPPPPPPSQVPGSYPGAHPSRAQAPTGQAPTARKPPPPPPPPPTNNARSHIDPPFVEATRVRTPYVAHSEERTFFSTEPLKTNGSASRLRPNDVRENERQAQENPQQRRHSASPPHKVPAHDTNDGSGPSVPPSHSYAELSSSGSSDSDLESGLSSAEPKSKARPKAKPSASWKKYRDGAPPLGKSKSFEGSQSRREETGANADRHPQTIFTLPITPETFTPTSAVLDRSQAPPRIDTNFSSSGGPVPFSSNSGAGAEVPPKASQPGYFAFRGRGPSQSHEPPTNSGRTSPDRVSPQSGANTPANPAANPPGQSPGASFSADHWNKELQDVNWASKWAHGPPHVAGISPTRNTPNSRRGRGGGIRSPSSETSTTARQPMTPQPASIAEEEMGDPSLFTGSRRLSADEDAMDIDPTPPSMNGTRPSTTDGSAQQQPRHVYVEPTMADWHARPAKEERRASYPAHLPPPPSNPPPAASNLTPNLSMNDFRHVPPFQTKSAGTGLQDLGDMSGNLPFPSRPSAIYPEKAPSRVQELPKVPRRPSPPEKLDKASWGSYIEQMTLYLNAWNAFNKQMTDYFQACAVQQIDMEKGPAGGMVEGWLQALGETGTLGGWDMYVRGQQEQQKMRMHWQAAHERHRDAVESHSKLRDRILTAGLQ